jgi:hypothetical protein
MTLTTKIIAHDSTIRGQRILVQLFAKKKRKLSE